MRFGEYFGTTYRVAAEGKMYAVELLEFVSKSVRIPHYQRELIDNFKSSAKKLTAFFMGDLEKTPVIFSRVGGEAGELNLHDGLQRVGAVALFFSDAGRVFGDAVPDGLDAAHIEAARSYARRTLRKLGIINQADVEERLPRWKEFKEFFGQVYGIDPVVEGLRNSDRISIGLIEGIDPDFAVSLYRSAVAYRILEFGSAADEVAHFIRLNKVGDPLSSVHVSLLLLGDVLSNPVKVAMGEVRSIFRGTRNNRNEANLRMVMYILMNTWDVEAGAVRVSPDMVRLNDQGKHYEMFAARLRRKYESLPEGERGEYYRRFENAVRDIAERVLLINYLKAAVPGGKKQLSNAAFVSLFTMGIMDYPLYSLKGMDLFGGLSTTERLLNYYHLLNSARNLLLINEKDLVFDPAADEKAGELRNSGVRAEAITPAEALRVSNNQNNTKRREMLKAFMHAAEEVYGPRYSVLRAMEPAIRRAVLRFVQENDIVVEDPYSRGRRIAPENVGNSSWYEIDHVFGVGRNAIIVTITSRRNNRGKGIMVGERGDGWGTFFKVHIDAAAGRVTGVELL